MTQTADIRHVVVDLLMNVTEDHRMLAELLPKRLSPLAPEDRARVQRLVLLTLRSMDRADRMLGPYLRLRPYPRIMHILRLGVAEICTGGAPHGVVNACVNLARARHDTERSSGLINAVLRKIVADKEKWSSLPVPRLPKWLRKPLIADFGKAEIERIEAAHYAGAAVDLTTKSTPEQTAELVNGICLPTGSVRLDAPGQISQLPGFDSGQWWVQDASAALPAKALGAKSGMRVLDLCAAPGGKTMQLANSGAEVVAVDVSATRMKRVTENLTRTGLAATLVTSDALEFEAEPFDAVLLDAPCTATGTIRRHPDLPYAKDGSDFPQLFELQEHLIDRAANLLRPGGRLVYCTCSLLIDEGEEQVRDALARRSDLVLDLGCLNLPGIDPSWIGDEGLRILPSYFAEYGYADGFFITSFLKQ